MFVFSGFLQLIIFAISDIVNSDVGQIFISEQDPTAGGPMPQEYSFSSSDLSNKKLTVYALVFASNNPSVVVAKTDDINISCAVSTEGFRLSGVHIEPAFLDAEHNSTQIALGLTTAGRPVIVSCSGESMNASCPASAESVQFCPATSQSNSVSITIRPKGSVSICQRQVRIRNNGNGSDCGFAVRLSEPAASPVTVNCTASGRLVLNISPLEIAAGSVDGRMTCRTVTWEAGSETNVTCSAMGDRAFNDQTLVDTSIALFTMGANSVSFQPAWSQIYSTTFTPYFYLSDPVDAGTVKVSCQASVVSSMDEATRPADCSFTQVVPTTAPTTSTTTTTATTATTVTTETTVETTVNGTVDNTTVAPPTLPPPTALPDPSSDWRVINAVFDLSRGSTSTSAMFQPVTTERVRVVIRARTEIVVTTCCVMPSSSATNYHNHSAVSVAVAHLVPFVCAGCRNATVTNPSTERTLHNPGFVAVAPCACDLTQNGCDVNCCCDPECSQNERARFSGCVAGLPGGQPAESEEYKCSSQAFNQPDWQTLTCVYWENNYYLGLFYQNAKKLQNIEDMNSQVARAYRAKFSFSETERPFSDKDSTQPDYTYGTVVRTIREDIVANPPARTGTLSLPQPGPGDSCNPLTPVRYLVDQTSSCKTAVTQELCSHLTTLSARIYLASSAISGCSQSYKVARSVAGNQVAPTDVLYHCARGIELCPYLNLEGQSCLEYNRNHSTAVSPALPAPCSWDDSFTTPPTPDFTSGSCTNAVVDVRYTFEWKGHEISKLSAVVILADMSSVNMSGLELVQQFSVRWLNKPNTTVPLSDNFAGTSDPYSRSGTAGYVMGKPLMSGHIQRNTSTGQFELVDVALEKQMAVWSPDVSGVCGDARRQPVTFGEDVLSGCVLPVTFSDLNNTCDDLRQQIINDFNLLMAADVIGQYGLNDISNENMWIPVLRQALNGSTSVGNSSSMSNVTSLNETMEELKSWADSITGVCLLPSAANLHILYSQTGAVNGFPRYEVLGAYVNYTISNYTMDCLGSNTGRCHLASGNIQHFLLSSSVTFTLVSARTMGSPRRFDTKCNPDSFLTDACYRYFTDFAAEDCYYDTCWQELAYPLWSGYQGDPQMYALPFFLVLVLAVIGYVSVARPGWSIPMPPCLYLLSPGSRIGGNYCTISRISKHLKHEGYQCHLDDPKELPNRLVFGSTAQQEDVGIMIGIHALRAGAFMKDSYMPYILILGGTDIFCDDPASMEVMTQAVYRARFLVCFSKVNQERALWLWPKIQPQNLKVIPQAVETCPSSFCLQTYLENHHPHLVSGHSTGLEPIIFVFVGGIRPVKNPLFLVPTFQDWHARNNRIIYLIVGPQLDATFTAAMFEPAISKRPGIAYIPGLPVEDAHAVISQSFALVNTSDSEGMCLAILEAMQMGIPVLVRDCPGNRAIVSDGQTGQLFDTPQMFLEKAEELLDSNKLLSDLTRNARDYVHAHHSVQQERRAYASLLEQCLPDIQPSCHSAGSKYL